MVITTTGGEVAQDRNGQELTCPGSESMRILRILQMASKKNGVIDYEAKTRKKEKIVSHEA